MKEKMKKVIQKEREKHRTEMQNAKVRFPMHTTNAYRSTFIQSIAVLMSSDSLPSSHHDNLFLVFLANQDILKWYRLCYDRLQVMTPWNLVHIYKVQNYISSKSHIPEDSVLLFVMPNIVFWNRNLDYVISNSSYCYYWNRNQLVETNPSCWHKIFYRYRDRWRRIWKHLVGFFILRLSQWCTVQ